MIIDDHDSPDPVVHTTAIADKLGELVGHLRGDIDKVSEPRAQALFETAAEVLTGLRTAFSHYGEHKEKAWTG
ncbi:hypothetical protein [Candidatus Mycobacterium methanotrophicum]|uniref:Uncharacterized protein n=1 Tax=Candidatus Mycobacterium methanotrophicum TaxID=2943498 RepID=A0ABY4QPU9_9MYCO|nr:hypothetical protein [Candidatus Mycobacterium methanotrophicum]UQX12649.1 hypothetical protein M5I08_10855 [Candidatus Mycobacterium methanotrophicum]